MNLGLRAALAVLVGFAIGSATPLAEAGNAPAPSQEAPAAAEKNAPGDIPDSQVFVEYRSPLGFSLKVPEGWARTDRGNGARFLDKYDSVDISVAGAAVAPTAADAAKNEVVTLLKTGRAVKIASVKDVRTPSGSAVLINYTSNSDPNPVTNKQIRLENDRYLFFKAGKLATLDLSAPLGADNVDQWQLMGQSFRWN
jgi:hypothetical protein